MIWHGMRIAIAEQRLRVIVIAESRGSNIMSDKDNFKICPKTAAAAVEYLRGVGHADAAASLEGVLKIFLGEKELK